MKHILLGMSGTLMFFVPLVAQFPDTTMPDSVAMEAIQEPDTYVETGKETKFFGDYYVGIDKVSRDNIRIFGGDLFVAGRVDGQIMVLGGDVTLESSCIVNGQIVAVGGSILKKEGAVVHGKLVEANIKEGISYSEGAGHEEEPEQHTFKLERRMRRSLKSWIHPDIHWFVYNRNEGFVWTPFNWRWDRRSQSSIRLSVSLGYRFGQNELAGRFTLEKGFLENRNLVVFASAFNESRTDDSYRLPKKENTLAAFLARQDFYDRWNEQGYELGMGFDVGWARIKAAYRYADTDSISITRRQARFFQKNRLFRSNEYVPVIPGDVRSLLATLSVRTPGLTELSTGAGLIVSGDHILKADKFGSFTRMKTTFMANWEFATDIFFRSRFLAGATTDTLPAFQYFGVGGLGSVSGYPYKLQLGDRMLQANVELMFLPDFFDGDLYISLFADAGYAWMQKAHGFTDLQSITDETITAIGIGLGDEDMDWRINIARPLDGRDVWETTFRLNLNF